MARPHGVALKFARMVEMRHQRQRLLRIVVVHEFVRPVGQYLGADADVDQIGQIGGQQRFDIGGEVLRRHDHRVAAGEQDVGNLRVAVFRSLSVSPCANKKESIDTEAASYFSNGVGRQVYNTGSRQLKADGFCCGNEQK